MTNVTINEVLSSAYKPIEGLVPPTALTTALLLIDIQHMATPDYLQGKALEAGLPSEGIANALANYSERFQASLLNCQRLLRAARQCGIPPVHVKIQAMSNSARDTGSLHKRLGWMFPPGSKGADFLPEVQPMPGEVIVTKTASGAFTGTSLDSVLRNMGIEYLFVCGFVTDECVETTTRVALDLGYIASIVSDATTTYHAEKHQYVIRMFQSFGLVQNVAQVEKVFSQMVEK